MSGNTFQQADIAKSKTILDNELQNWLAGHFVVGFDKADFNADDVMRTIQQQPKFSLRITNWKTTTKNEEMLVCVTAMKDQFIEENPDKNAFKLFMRENLDNPKYKNKYVAFVNGIFQDYGDRRNKLVHSMYQKFGNVRMYVEKVTTENVMGRIDTPERK